MNILLLGPPGSGKGVQSKLIQKQFNTFNVSLGELFRKEIFNNSVLGEKIKHCISNGLLVDDLIACEVFKKNVCLFDNVLLDGFPRNINQALFLESIKFHVNYIIKLNVSEELLLKRIKYRLVNSQSSFSYNIIYQKPKLNQKDNESGVYLFSRLDDKYITFKARLLNYTSQIDSLIEFFIKRKKLIISINAEDTAFNVFKKIKNEIYKYE